MIDLNKAIQLDSNFFGSYYLRAEIKSHLKDLRGALIDFNKAIQINPKIVLHTIKELR